MTSSPPAPLLVAASLVAVEGLVLVLYGVLEAAAITGGRVTMGVTTAIFFLAYGGGLLACAWALRGRRSWARGPVVLAQLIQLGLAWSFRGSAPLALVLALAGVALVVLVGVFHPASLDALADEPDPG